jgi:hypothetical protein
MISSFFPSVWRAGAAPKRKEKKRVCGRLFTRGGGLGGLAPGYNHAASPRLSSRNAIRKVLGELGGGDFAASRRVLARP